MCIFFLSRFQQADFVQPWKTKTCHGRKSWRMIHLFKDTFRCLAYHHMNLFCVFGRHQTVIFIRRRFSEFLWILLSLVLTQAWCKGLTWWVNYYWTGTYICIVREMKFSGKESLKTCNFCQPGGEKAIKIVESKRKELAALMKASLPPCDRMGLICRLFTSFYPKTPERF